MASYTVTAVRTTTYEVDVEATDPASAIEKLDDWISDDFEGFEVSGHWQMEAH
jgi:hypothetical protein